MFDMRKIYAPRNDLKGRPATGFGLRSREDQAAALEEFANDVRNGTALIQGIVASESADISEFAGCSLLIKYIEFPPGLA